MLLRSFWAKWAWYLPLTVAVLIVIPFLNIDALARKLHLRIFMRGLQLLDGQFFRQEMIRHFTSEAAMRPTRDSFQKGMNAADRKVYDEAIAAWRPLALTPPGQTSIVLHNNLAWAEGRLGEKDPSHYAVARDAIRTAQDLFKQYGDRFPGRMSKQAEAVIEHNFDVLHPEGHR